MSIQSSAIISYIPVCARNLLPDTQARFPAYTEITRRIPQNELLEIEKNMQCLSPRDQQRFIELTEEGDISSIVQMTDYPLHALYAVKVGKITQEEFATITLVYASPDANKTCIKMFDANGKVSSQAKDLIEQTLYLIRGKVMTSAELDSFFKEMAKLPPLQQQFFLEEPQASVAYGEAKFFGQKITGELPTIRSEIKRAYHGLNVFSKCRHQEEPKSIIPSAGMMQTFLDVKFRKDAVRMNFVLGLSSMEDIQNNGLESSRDVALRFPGTSLLNTADQFPAIGTDFTYHDWFHSFVVSCAPHETRRNMISIANSIKGIANPSLRNYVIDLEMGGHFVIKFVLKQPVANYSKFLFDLDQKLGSAVMHDPSLVQDPSYRHRVFYQIAKEFHQNIQEFQAYNQWGEELTQNQIYKYSSKALELQRVVEEIKKEIRIEDDSNSANSLRIRKLQAVNELLSEDFTEATIAELEDKKSQLEQGILDVQKKMFSNCVILRSIEEDLTAQSNMYKQTVDALKMLREYRNQAPVVQILKIMENNCFSETAPGICISNSTMQPFDAKERMQVPSLSGRAILKPENLLIGVIAMLFLRVLFRRSSK